MKYLKIAAIAAASVLPMMHSAEYNFETQRYCDLTDERYFRNPTPQEEVERIIEGNRDTVEVAADTLIPIPLSKNLFYVEKLKDDRILLYGCTQDTAEWRHTNQKVLEHNSFRDGEYFDFSQKYYVNIYRPKGLEEMIKKELEGTSFEADTIHTRF